MKLFICLIALAVAAAATTPSIELYKDMVRSPEDERIINGRDCDFREITYQVSIVKDRLIPLPGVLEDHICGGTLITTKHVLTAAHCKQRKGSYTVILGQHDRSILPHRDIQKIKVKEFIIHEKFPGGVAKYDIGILVLKKAARLSPAVQVANLPASESECEGLSQVMLSGWGLTGGLIPTLPIRLKCAELPIISNEECGKNLTSIIGNAGPLDDTQICSGTTIGRKPQSACNGDSGGPLVVRQNSTVVGIVSWGISPCGTKNAPSVYTKVCSYLDWIKENTE